MCKYIDLKLLGVKKNARIALNSSIKSALSEKTSGLILY